MVFGKKEMIELLIFILSITGACFIGVVDNEIQVLGFIVWVVANIIGMFYFAYRKMYIISIQYAWFFVMAIKAILNRLIFL